MNKSIRIKKKRYNLLKGNAVAKNLIELPVDSVIKIFSEGDISIINLITLIGNNATINELTAATLRIGRKEMQVLDIMHKRGKLKNATFIFSGIMRQAGKVERKYDYYGDVVRVCQKNGWRIIEKNNHAKVYLLDTDKGKHVIETSSNLNENPKNEQFSFEQSDELYDFYYEVLHDS